MTTTTNTIKTPAVAPVDTTQASPLYLFNTGIAAFIGEVEGMMAEEREYYKPPFLALPDYFRRGVDTVHDDLWPLLMEMGRLLQQTKHGRSVQDNERFHQLSLKITKYLCYSEGMGAVERAALNTTIVRPDSTFSGN